MSTLDISKIVSSLTSTKIKDRNDALNLLETIHTSKFKLTSKQFKILVQGIFNLIQYESNVFQTNKSTAVHNRLVRACNSLRILTEKSIDDPKLNLSYKTYLDLLDRIIEQYGLHLVLQVCSVDMMVIFAKILGISYFKEHLTRPEWLKIFDYLMNAVETLVSEMEDGISSTTVDKLVIELFTAIQNLLQCKTSTSITYLQLFSAKTYHKLPQLIERAIPHYKKENILIVVLFRIINKLIIVLSTHDFQFINSLIRTGITLFLTFHNSSWNSIQVQFLIFLNTSATHNFINLLHLPKVDENDDFLLVDKETSVRSDESDCDPKQQRSYAVLIYDIRILILNIINKLNTSSFHFNDDIAVVHNNNDPITWFRLKSIYLQSENYKPWLLTLGLTKLILSYFKLKSSVIKDSIYDGSRDILGSSGSFAPSFRFGNVKRQKLDFLADSITNSNNILEFCNKLIDHKLDSRYQQVGLQVLTFYLESYTRPEELRSEPVPFDEFQLDDTFHDLDTTIGSFEIPISTDNDSLFNKNVIFKNILSRFDNSQLNYWSLVTCRSLICDYLQASNHAKARFHTHYYFQLLKISLQLIKHQELSNIACNLVYLIIVCQSKELTTLADSSIVTQLDNLIDMSEINGPFLISNESFHFWYGVHKVVKNINLSKRDILASRIQDWMVAKWSGTFESTLEDIFFPNSGLSEFISWLCGGPVSCSPFNKLPNLYLGILNEAFYFLSRHTPLEDFIVLNPQSNGNSETPMLELDSFAESNSYEDLISTINQTTQLYKGRSPVALFEWTMLVSKVADNLREQRASQHIVSSLDYQIKSAFELISESELNSELIYDMIWKFNRIQKYTKLKLEMHFSFTHDMLLEVLMNSINSVDSDLVSFGNNRVDPQKSIIEEEFSEVTRRNLNSNSRLTEDFLNPLQLTHLSVPLIEILEFLVLKEKLQMNDINVIFISLLVFIEKLEPPAMLASMYYIVDYMESDEVDVSSISTISLKKIVRLMGENILTLHTFEKSELTIIVLAKLLSQIVSTFPSSKDESLIKDCHDMCNWLFQCGSKDLILTESANIEFCNFLIQFLISNDQSLFHNSQLRNILLESFVNSTNAIKIQLVASFKRLMAASNSSDQALLYNDLFQAFPTPQKSLESSATFTLFFNQLSQVSTQVMLSSVFNLLELNKFCYVVPYIRESLDRYCDYMNLGSPKELLGCLRFEILRCWWKYDKIQKFPYSLFGYTDINRFYSENYKELLAISISTKISHTSDIPNLLKVLGKVKDSNDYTLIRDSLSLIIPLSYSKDGIRNEVFDVLSSFLGNKFKRELQEKLILIILEIIIYTDISCETGLLEIFKGNQLASDLISRDSVRVSEGPGAATVSLSSSLELLNKLVQKYSSKKRPFWGQREVYFLLRRVFNLIKDPLNIDQKTLILRKVKLIILLGSDAIHNIRIIKLLVDNLCPLLRNQEICSEIYRFFAAMKIQNFQRYKEEESLPLILKVTTSLLDLSSLVEAPSPLADLEFYIKTLDSTRKVYSIILSAIDIMKQSRIICSSRAIEDFLDDEDEFGIFVKDGSKLFALRLISLIFPWIKIYNDKGCCQNVVRILIEANSSTYSRQTKAFKLWSADYLATFYLNGGFRSGTKSVLPLLEYEAFGKNFELEIKLMDLTLLEITKRISGSDHEEAACGESILGALIYLFEDDIKSVLDYFNFRTFYETYSEFIIPLDDHSCFLLNDDLNVEFLESNDSNILSDLKPYILYKSFGVWTTKLFLALIQKVGVLGRLMQLLSTFIIKFNSFAEVALPFFICYYINCKGTRAVKVIVDLIDQFVEMNCSDDKSIGLFINIILLIRIGSRKGLTHFENVMKAIDLKGICKVAAHNKLFKTAVMLYEDSCCEEPDYSLLLDDNKFLSSVYESIDTEDLIYGLPAETSLDYALKMLSRDHESSDQLKVDSATFDASISLDLQPKRTNILLSMLNNGLLGVSRLISKSDQSNSISDSYEWCWKLNRWEMPIPCDSINEHEVIYKTLKQIHDYPIRSQDVCQDSLLDILHIKDKLVNDNLSSKEYRSNIVGWIRTLSTVYSIQSIVKYPKDELNGLFETSDRSTAWFMESDMLQSENILLARQTTFQLLAEFGKDETTLSKENIWLGAIHELVRYNNLATFSREFQKMVNSTILLDEISKSKFNYSSTGMKANIENISKFQAAFSLWSQGQAIIPVLMLKDLEKAGGISLPLKTLQVHQSIISSHIIEWMADSRQDLASNIMEKYVLPTSEMVKSLTEVEQRVEVYQRLAHFCEEQYKSRGLREEISKLEKRVNSKQQEIIELKLHYGKTSVPAEEKHEVQLFYSKLKIQLHAETKDLKAATQSKENFCDKAIVFLLKSILGGDYVDEYLDKFFAMWLEHSNKEELNRIIKDDVLKLPSYMLISWSSQLISRLSNEKSEFQSILQALVLDMCYSHPHHTLYQLMSLRKHRNYIKEGSNNFMVSKYLAANQIWEQLKTKPEPFLKEILNPIEKFCDEAVKLSELKASKGKSIHLDKVPLGSYWINELPSIPPPTNYIGVDKTSNYQNVPTFVSIETKVTIATSGLSLPKIAKFLLSNGSEHRILLKHGTDDLRQDSIMEQVFEKVNNIFDKDKETRKRNLRIRTYRAVPMGPQSGMIEFVPNSVALIDIVKPYHVKHDQFRVEKARAMMKECQTGEKTARYLAYNEISTKITPVLRYFFFDNFVTPDTWFDSRVSYTRGIATTSMVGHVLGLGDRHCNNILLDKRSGEPIHIDLGVAFDQGKRLPIPETVPFRLTRDIVDGFGITGVEGVFKRSCEHTFRVLRSNKDHILSILDVLRWDPLYSWSLSPIRKKKLQDATGTVAPLQPEADGSEAGRAVITVSDKLTAGGLSVEATVRELVQEATNPQNLALIYFGWCPFY